MVFHSFQLLILSVVLLIGSSYRTTYAASTALQCGPGDCGKVTHAQSNLPGNKTIESRATWNVNRLQPLDSTSWEHRFIYKKGLILSAAIWLEETFIAGWTFLKHLSAPVLVFAVFNCCVAAIALAYVLSSLPCCSKKRHSSINAGHPIDDDLPSPEAPSTSRPAVDERQPRVQARVPLSGFFEPAWELMSIGNGRYEVEKRISGTGTYGILHRAREAGSGSCFNMMLKIRDYTTPEEEKLAHNEVDYTDVLSRAMLAPKYINLLGDPATGKAYLITTLIQGIDMKEMAAAYNTQEGFFRKLCIIVFQAFQKLHAKEFIHGNFTSSHFKLHSVEEDLEFVFLDLSLADHYHQPFIAVLRRAFPQWSIPVSSDGTDYFMGPEKLAVQAARYSPDEFSCALTSADPRAHDIWAAMVVIWSTVFRALPFPPAPEAIPPPVAAAIPAATDLFGIILAQNKWFDAMAGRPIRGDGRSSAVETMSTLSPRAQAFIRYVFNRNANKRPTAEKILQHSYLN